MWICGFLVEACVVDVLVFVIVLEIVFVVAWVYDE